MKKIKLLICIFIFLMTFCCSFVFADETLDTISLTADSAILMDSNTSKILYGKNEKEKMYPASTTKIMTAILVLENCDLSENVTASYEAISSVPSGYSVASIQVGEVLSVEQLLQVLLIHSANDAANVLAEYVGGSIESFATMMNTKANEIGCTNTNFTNPSGKHDENHYTTSYDLALIMQYCMKNSTFRSIAGSKSCLIPETNKYEQRIYTNTNELLIKDTRDILGNYYYQYAIAGKTGYTTQAKNCLVSVSNKNGLEFICVILGAGLRSDGLSARFLDSKTLFEYGYENYSMKKIREKNAIAKQIEIQNGTKDTRNLDLLISDDITALVKTSENIDALLPNIVLNENLSAPISQNEVVGYISYDIDGIEYKVDLLASHGVEKSNFLGLIIEIFFIIIILFLLSKLMISKKRKKRKRKY